MGARAQVHERSIEIDLLLLLLRDVVARRAAAAAAGATGSPAQPLHLVLMSATADAQLFADYMVRQQGAAGQASSRKQGASGAGGESKMAVGQLTIPGFTYPVRDLYLEVRVTLLLS